MDNVSLFVKTIVALTFMWCIAEVAIPDNSLQKYSSFIYGLVIISLTLSVFTKVNFDDFFVNTDTADISEYNNNYLKNLYEKKVEESLQTKFDDKNIDVELTEEYKIKNIICKNNKTYENIMRYLNE